MPTIYELVELATEELKEGLENGEYNNEDDIYDAISEIADSYIPVYNYDLLQVAMSNLRLSCTKPEL